MKKFSLQNRSINESEQAEKLKSREMKEGGMKNDDGWMKDVDFNLLRGFADRLADRRTNRH